MQNGRALGGARNNESGETLVETLITVAVVGIAFVAILAGIFTALRVSDYHRKTTTADIVLRNYAEIVKAPTGTYAYKPCTSAGGSVTYDDYTPAAPLNTYTALVSKYRYLTGYVNGEPQWSDVCPAADLGAQELTLLATGPSTDPAVRGTERVVTIKRNATEDVP
jgi:hypothetical protein